MNEQQQYAFREDDRTKWSAKRKPVEKGDPVTSFRGRQYTFEAIRQPANGGSEGRVSVTRQCVDFDPETGVCPHHWHTDGIDRDWFFPSVVGLYLGTADGTPAR